MCHTQDQSVSSFRVAQPKDIVTVRVVRKNEVYDETGRFIEHAEGSWQIGTIYCPVADKYYIGIIIEALSPRGKERTLHCEPTRA
jgi:hypothetical protein